MCNWQESCHGGGSEGRGVDGRRGSVAKRGQGWDVGGKLDCRVRGNDEFLRRPRLPSFPRKNVTPCPDTGRQSIKASCPSN